MLGPCCFPSCRQTFLGLSCNGGYADYLSTHHTAFVKVENHAKWTGIQAAPVMSTFGTVWQGAVVRGKLAKGERVLVTGAAGGVGSAAVTIASRLGAYVIGSTGNLQGKEAYLKKLGADQVISSGADHLHAHTHTHTHTTHTHVHGTPPTHTHTTTTTHTHTHSSGHHRHAHLFTASCAAVGVPA